MTNQFCLKGFLLNTRFWFDLNLICLSHKTTFFKIWKEMTRFVSVWYSWIRGIKYIMNTSKISRGKIAQHFKMGWNHFWRRIYAFMPRHSRDIFLSFRATILQVLPFLRDVNTFLIHCSSKQECWLYEKRKHFVMEYPHCLYFQTTMKWTHLDKYCLGQNSTIPIGASFFTGRQQISCALQQ